MVKDLREFIDSLKREAPEEFITIKHVVDPKFELSAIVRRLEMEHRTPVIFFEKVKGTKFPVICNLLSSKKKMAMALGVTEDRLLEEFQNREEKPLPLKRVSYGPVKEIVLTQNKVNLLQLPQIVHNEKDGGAYITTGVMITRDPDSGAYNDGCYRLMIKGKRRLGIHLSEFTHAYRIYRKYEERNEAMDVVIIIGHHPAFLLGSLARVPFGTNELEVTGSIMGESLEVVDCETVNLEAPAYAEILIEGKIPPGVRRPEGPFGEFMGVYGQSISPEIEVTSISMRNDAIFHDLYSSGIEHRLWATIPRLSRLYKLIKNVFPQVKDVNLPLSGRGFLCYISMEKVKDTDPIELIMASFVVDPLIKYCVVVDPDINILSDEEVIYAVTTRLQPDKGILIIRNCGGSVIDPVATEGYTKYGALNYIVTKIGIDATKPISGFPDTVAIPGVDKIKIEDYLNPSS